MSDTTYEFVAGCAMAVLTYLLMFPVALLFQWAWGLIAPTFGWPPLDYWPAFGLLLVSRLLVPYRVVAIRRES